MSLTLEGLEEPEAAASAGATADKAPEPSTFPSDSDGKGSKSGGKGKAKDNVKADKATEWKPKETKEEATLPEPSRLTLNLSSVRSR